jgi:hypothetical protein
MADQEKKELDIESLEVTELEDVSGGGEGMEIFGPDTGCPNTGCPNTGCPNTGC